MGRRKWITGASALMLAITSLSAAGGAAGAQKPGTKTGESYLVAFQNELPSNYRTIIENAGGQVSLALPELGSVEAVSSNVLFLSNLSKEKSITAANKEMKHTLSYKNNDPAAADGLPVTDIPQPSEIDSYWSFQWDMQRLTADGASYEIETGGTNESGTVKHKAVVGVIDSGIDAGHPDLVPNYLGGRNLVPAGVDRSETGDPDDVRDRDGHGTHVAGSIAANGKIKGVGPDLGLRSYRVFPAEGGAYTSWIVGAILAAVKDKVDVINMSIGGFDALSPYSFGNETYSDVADMVLYKRAIRYAVNNNVTVVTAAGNESLNLNNPTDVTAYMNETYGPQGFVFKGASIEVPGQLPGVVNVSSSNGWSDKQIAFYSNYGTRSIDVAAPGGDNGPLYDQTRDLNLRDFHYRTLSTWPTYLEPYFTANLNSYALLHGTSMASPKVAGIAGIIKAAHPEYSPAQVKAVIQQTALDMGKPGSDDRFGSGEANAFQAVSE
jgi:lantibiotic leader peptide-processing serine protease